MSGELKVDRDVIGAFITLLSSKPCIYSQEDSHHRDPLVVNMAWRQILEELAAAYTDEQLKVAKISCIRELKNKYSNLRTTFFREKKKVGAYANVKKKWLWYDALSFLDGHPVHAADPLRHQISNHFLMDSNVMQQQQLSNSSPSYNNDDDEMGLASEEDEMGMLSEGPPLMHHRRSTNQIFGEFLGKLLDEEVPKNKVAKVRVQILNLIETATKSDSPRQ